MASLARLERATLCFVGRCSDPAELQRGRLAGEAGIEPAHGLTQNQVPYRLGYSPSVWRKREDSNLCGLAAHPLSRRRRSTGLRHASMTLAPRERIELPPRVLETPVLPLHQRGAVPGPWTPGRTEDLAIIDRVLDRLSYPRSMMAERQGVEPWCRAARATIRLPTGALGPLGHLSGSDSPRVAAVFHPGATRTPTARCAPLRGGVGLAGPIFRCR